ncbi:unnamed protein product [Linum trigynum]|uniref:Uncharacterized protein n=1 Tax=Linum trigynum TaxID=586398 RepID=A0AAV2F7P8_9ROSI
MDNLPISIGGDGNDAGSSSQPLPDLNLPIGGDGNDAGSSNGNDAGSSSQPLPDFHLPPAAAPEPEQEPNPYIVAAQLHQEEIRRKNVKRLRAFQGLVNHWERERERAIRLEMERYAIE